MGMPVNPQRNGRRNEFGQMADKAGGGEIVREALGEAFAKHWKDKTGRSLNIDCRIPGGTSDITRVLDSSF